MISGTIENSRYPYVDIELIGAETTVTLKALVDTGFDGDIGLDYKSVFQMKLPFHDVIRVDYADGESRLELVCRAAIKWDGDERMVDIVCSNDEQPSLGTNLMRDHVLMTNFAKGHLEINKATDPNSI